MRDSQDLQQSEIVGSALVVEDHPLYRDALVHLLHAILGESKVTSVSSVEEGVRSAANISELRLILLDVGLPGLSGTEAVMAMRRTCPNATLIVVSASEDRRDVTAALRAGAQFFVSKTIGTDILSDIVRRVLAGELPEQPAWISQSGKAAFLEESLPSLTPRQRQVLVLLSNGYSNKEIGLRLDLAEVTVKMHVSSIFRALGVANRTQAVLAARRLGLYGEEPPPPANGPSHS